MLEPSRLIEKLASFHALYFRLKFSIGILSSIFCNYRKISDSHLLLKLHNQCRALRNRLTAKALSRIEKNFTFFLSNSQKKAILA